MEERYLKLVNLVTGLRLSLDELIMIGERVYNLERMFNVREGVNRSVDIQMPRRMETPKTCLLGDMLEEYYRLRGWDSNGVPSKETLNRLSLE